MKFYQPKISQSRKLFQLWITKNFSWRLTIYYNATIRFGLSIIVTEKKNQPIRARPRVTFKKIALNTIWREWQRLFVIIISAHFRPIIQIVDLSNKGLKSRKLYEKRVCDFFLNKNRQNNGTLKANDRARQNFIFFTEKC